ncbi:hypothetical protein AB7M16_002034 [Bradyrhizobium sp. USDA 372]
MLFDHAEQPRYIGVTEMGIRRRVAGYHVGGDGNSHKFSTIYNAGRMFHDRNSIHSCLQEGRIAKELRRLFARAHCRAVGVPLPGLAKADLFAVEAELRRIAPSNALSWNNLRALDAYEPVELVDQFLNTLSWPAAKLAAIHRQAERWRRMRAANAGKESDGGHSP